MTGIHSSFVVTNSGIHPISFPNTFAPNYEVPRGCRDSGYCTKCNIIARDYTCFCAGICPRCRSWCGDIPKNLTGTFEVVYTSGKTFFARYKDGKFIEETLLPKADPVKLHLGCYQKKIHGYVNVDIRADVNPDVVDDVFKLPKFKENTVEVIYACHVLEHARPEEARAALKRWYSLLKTGGILRIAVPDIQAVMEYYRETCNLEELRSFIWGSQKHPYDIHYTGWDYNSLVDDLEAVGFKKTCRYDWRATEHFYIDDYSQSYMPQIAYKSRRLTDRIEGKQMSLNVEATK